MTKHRLTPRQKKFVEYCHRYIQYPTHTDAYLAVYNSKGSRRTATANASRIYNKPAVQAYLDKLDEIHAQRTHDKAEEDHKRFLASLGITR